MADVYSIVVDFLHKGGFFIYPISLVFVIGLAIALERWIYLQYEKSRNSYAFKDFLPLLRDINIDKMREHTRENAAPVIRVIGCGLDMLKVSRQRADVENAMSEGMLETMPRLEQRTNYLALLANVATLLGLLGTIIGLIGAFEAVAKADPSEKSQLLSTSISVAMNTTAVGLITAIPLLILNGLLQNKTKAIVTGIEMSAVKFLNVMTLNRQIEAGMPRGAGEGGTGGLSAVAAAADEGDLEARPATLKAKKDASMPLEMRLKQAEGSIDGESPQAAAADSSSQQLDSAADVQAMTETTANGVVSAEMSKPHEDVTTAAMPNQSLNAEHNGVHIPISPQASGVTFAQPSAMAAGVEITSTTAPSQVETQDISLQVNAVAGITTSGSLNTGHAENGADKDKNNIVSG